MIALAGYVDQKMNELAQQTPTVDTLKVAILAAMYIADDLQTATRKVDGLTDQVENKVQLMLERLEPLLETAADQTAAD